MELQIEDLKKAIGIWIENHKGEIIGKVEDIKIDARRNIPEYLILCCTHLFGRGNRYFAVPATSSLIDISPQGEITLKLDKEILPMAMGVPADECPKFDPDISDSVFELYKYGESRLTK